MGAAGPPIPAGSPARGAAVVARAGWLRAAVLGANDGVLSTAGLILGVAAASTDNTHTVLIAGASGLVAGALSMAAGEYVSVSSQRDAETAVLDKERRELSEDDAGERRELARIYVGRGLEPDLAAKVADALMAHDALGAHARDELGLSAQTMARPLQAALASAASYSAGAALPLILVAISPPAQMAPIVAGVSLVSLAALGAAGAAAGGAAVVRGAVRVIIWGAAAMAVTFILGRVFGAAG